MNNVNGNIQPIGQISGNISGNLNIVGNINIPDSISGNVQKDNESAEKISGNVSNDLSTTGNIGVPVNMEFEVYYGDYTVVPVANKSKVLETRDKYLLDNVTVLKVPYYQMSNQFGDTVYIASEV